MSKIFSIHHFNTFSLPVKLPLSLSLILLILEVCKQLLVFFTLLQKNLVVRFQTFSFRFLLYFVVAPLRYNSFFMTHERYNSFFMTFTPYVCKHNIQSNHVFFFLSITTFTSTFYRASPYIYSFTPPYTSFAIITILSLKTFQNSAQI